jgi:serine protease AprX
MDESRKRGGMPSGSMGQPSMPGAQMDESRRGGRMPSGSMGQPSMPGAQMGESRRRGGMPSGSMGQPSMPGAQRDESRRRGGMPSGSMNQPSPRPGGGAGGGERVLVEMRVPRGEQGLALTRALGIPGLAVDPNYPPVPMPRGGEEVAGLAAGEETVIVRATIDPNRKAELEADPNVVKIWTDGRIAPFGELAEEVSEFKLDSLYGDTAPAALELLPGMATCPIGICDCDPRTPKGTIGDVSAYLGADQIWAAGHRGDGIVVGVVDGGIRAEGRPTTEGGPKIGRVIGGWPTASWGTTAAAWGDHGNMCATDVLGMAPNAQIYDLRISDGDALSDALQAFQWAIDQHRANGTPHVLTNSWGMFQEAWDPDYCTNPNHPFTRKVIEAIDDGILVLFAAGNCGATCPDGRCDGDTGPGRSIWGANGHPRVITVGAVNRNEQFVGYSSQGPAALDPNKPDFCSITHFTGYFTSDSGTSAATPIAAGVSALLKQATPALVQDQLKAVLRNTAKDIGPAGFDQHSGAGIIRAEAAYEAGVGVRASGPVVAWGANRLDAFVIGTDSALYHKWWDGASWGPGIIDYEYMGGICTTRPEAVAWGPNRLDVFLLGTDHALYHKWWDGASWGPSITDYQYMGGICLAAPKAVAWGPNRLDVFVLGTDSAVYHKWWDGANWGPSVTDYEYQGGLCATPPEVVAWGPNRLDVFVLGTDHALYHKWWDGANWGPSLTGWEYLGGICASAPRAVAWGPNRLDIFVLGMDLALYHKWWDGANWGPGLTDWEYMGGICASEPAVVAWGANRLDVFLLGTDLAIYHKWWDGANWGPGITDYEYMGGICSSPPRVTAWGPNRLDVFVRGTDHALYHKWWDGASWGPSITGYEYQAGLLSLI